jgi:CRISPR/Cas system CSM-associated protein Csm3 (group 7 of RAMP superfamily)
MCNLKLSVNGKTIDLSPKNEGKVELYFLDVSITVVDGSFLHIGGSPSPLTEKKGAVFKVNGTPVIPATSFKGALRYQMELLFIEQFTNYRSLFSPENDNFIKPCIPTAKITKAEIEMLSKGYRGTADSSGRYSGHCEIQVDENRVNIGDLGICPVCYFMGCTGIMGFLRFNNFYPPEGDWLVDQTNIRIDRKTQTAAKGAKVDGEQVKPGTIFSGRIEIINKTPQGFEFGRPRILGGVVIDKWLEKWSENDINKRKQVFIKQILIPAIQNIKLLGGQKSKGAGKVKVKLDF